MVTILDISKKLTEAINQSGLTQKEIAQKIGVKQQQISSYVHNKNLPALDTLSRLCTVLDLDANDILCVERPKQY
ncbi:MAG: helix-turn-helix transcriptional regulator [Clostridia bacterium]|nr:helix-turn-helix transcriptional regulator [Clostridia bacterium]